MVCANCNREIEPIPYDRKEWYSKTKDAQKLKKAIKFYLKFGRCRRCMFQAKQLKENIKIAEVVAKWKAEQTLPAGLSGVDEIQTLYERFGGVEAVAERLGLSNIDYALSRKELSPLFTEGLGPGVCGAHIGFEEALVRIRFRRDALEQLLRDPEAAWRKAKQPIAYLKTCTKHNGDRAFKEWQAPKERERIMFNPWRAANWPQTNDAYVEGSRKFRTTLRKLGFNAAAIGVYVARICGWTRTKLTALARTPREKREIETAWRWIDRWWERVQKLEWNEFNEVFRAVRRLDWVSDEILVRCGHAVLRQQFPLPAPVYTRKQQRRRRAKGRNDGTLNRWDRQYVENVERLERREGE